MIRCSILFSLLLLATSCDKNNPDFFDATSRVTIKVQHHEDVLPGIEVYVQFNAEEIPGYEDRSIFDTVVVSDEFGDATFQSVPGRHWAVGYGFDENVGEDVRGRVPFEIEDFGIPWDTTIYVSEF